MHSISGGSSRLVPSGVLNSAIWWVFVALYHIHWWDLFWVCKLSSPDIWVCNNLHERELIISVNRNSDVRIHAWTCKYYSSCKLVRGWKQDSLLRNTWRKTARCTSVCILTKICSSDCGVTPLIRWRCSKPFWGIEYWNEGSHWASDTGFAS